MISRPLISFQEANSLISYDPHTGVFRWKVDVGNGLVAGSVAGSANTTHGYLSVMLKQRRYRLSRLAWLISYGEFPTEQVDHINCIKTDNRLENLRVATHSQNNANRRIGREGRLLPKGVYAGHKTKRFVARITVNKLHIHLGTFDTPEIAHAAYCVAAQSAFGEFWRAG